MWTMFTEFCFTGHMVQAPRWPIPPELSGSAELIRVYAGAAKEAEEDCPLLRAINARPAVRPLARTVYKPADFELFALAPMMNELDRVEFGRAREKSRKVHAGLARFTEHALARYLEASAALTETADLLPDPLHWVKQVSSDHLYELKVWGRGYATLDGTLRELRLPTFGAAGARERSEAEVATAAFVTAHGGRAAEARFGQKHDVQKCVLPQRVRIVEIGLLDGRSKVLFDGSPETAEASFKKNASTQLRATVDAVERRPGGSCLKCPLSTTCPALPRIPELLGVTDLSRPRRTLSVTDLRYHSLCPAKEHFRRLHLPSVKEVEYDRHVTRGHAVHAWLQHLHERRPRRRCTAGDIPENASDWEVGKWHLTGEDAELGARLIAGHAAICPLRFADPDHELKPEQSITFHDTAADVLVVAKPDLLYLSHGSWIWREVKSTKYHAARDDLDILEIYPQAALALILLAEGALGGDRRGSRVEVEILRPSGPDLELLSPNEPERVAKARDVIRGHAASWHADSTAAPNPGDHCARCEFSQWCPASPPDPKGNTRYGDS